MTEPNAAPFLRRYAAFLLTYLPQLQTHALRSPTARPASEGGLSKILDLVRGRGASRLIARGGPLAAAHEAANARPGACLQFGVLHGESIAFHARRQPARHFVGFDSFEGFPDDGRADWVQDFSTKGRIPAAPANVEFVKGYFSETLPRFLEDFDNEIALLNVDCDIYSSTSDIFIALGQAQRLKPGLIIAFDELINYRGFLANEMLALFEMLEREGLSLEWIAVEQHVRSAEETVRLIHDRTHPKWDADVASGFRQQASLRLVPGPLDMSLLSDPKGAERAASLAAGMRRLPPRIKPMRARKRRRRAT